MRATIILLSILIPGRSFSQDSINFISTWKYFKENHIALNVIEPPQGCQVYYNCDSMLFVRGDFSDTIKIWTPGVEWNYTLEQFETLKNKPEYGMTIFPKSILLDGRIIVESYWETIFVFRNDSLYEIDDSLSKPPEYFDMAVSNMLGKLDNATFTRKRDSIDQVYKDRHAYVPKLIFARRMFESGKKKVKLSKKVNYKQDEIMLEQEWVEDKKKCYLIRINNSEDGEKTTYAYAVNEDMKFVWWQGCSRKNLK